MQVAPLWFAAQFTFNVSLSETTVTSNTILASTSSLFTYALSCILLLEAFVVSKLLFIALAMGGKCPMSDDQCLRQNYPSKVLPCVMSSLASLTCTATPSKTLAVERRCSPPFPARATTWKVFCQAWQNSSAKGSEALLCTLLRTFLLDVCQAGPPKRKSRCLLRAQVLRIVQHGMSQSLYRQSMGCCRHDHGDIWRCEAGRQHAAEQSWRGFVGVAIRIVLRSIYGRTATCDFTSLASAHFNTLQVCVIYCIWRWTGRSLAAQR